MIIATSFPMINSNGGNKNGWSRRFWTFILPLRLSRIKKSVIRLASFSLHYQTNYLVVCNLRWTIIKFASFGVPVVVEIVLMTIDTRRLCLVKVFFQAFIP